MTEPSQRDMAEGVLTKHMPGVAKAVEDVLNKGKRVEISIVTDRKKQQQRVVVWAITSKKVYESQPLTVTYPTTD